VPLPAARPVVPPGIVSESNVTSSRSKPTPVSIAPLAAAPVAPVNCVGPRWWRRKIASPAIPSAVAMPGATFNSCRPWSPS
jgi:hypothetical protein